MRKQIITQTAEAVSSAEPIWLDVPSVAQVELSSEHQQFPIEAALTPGCLSGWRASQSGEQFIRLLFDDVQSIHHIRLEFKEDHQQRTQAFVLRWSADDGLSYREIVRQQYNFSPPDITREIEVYNVDLAAVTILELSIIPDISGGDAQASLAQLMIA